TAPVRGEQPAERRHEVAVAVVLHAPGQLLDLRRRVDDPYVVPQPLDEAARHSDGPLEGVHSRGVTDLVADGREQPVVAQNLLRSGVEEQEVARAIGVLRLAGAQARLTEGGRLLVTEDSRNGHTSHGCRALDLPEDLRGTADLR